MPIRFKQWLSTMLWQVAVVVLVLLLDLAQRPQLVSSFDPWIDLWHAGQPSLRASVSE